MTNKIKKAYQRSSDSNLMVLAHRISESMKSNPNFPNPIPSQADLEKASVEFQMAVSVAGRNDRTLSSAKNDRKAELIKVLNQLADYVTATSNGDKTKLLSSGFDVTGLKSSAPPLPPITVFTVEIGPPGGGHQQGETGSRFAFVYPPVYARPG